jgi:type I site-specific restriction endonuclease
LTLPYLIPYTCAIKQTNCKMAKEMIVEDVIRQVERQTELLKDLESSLQANREITLDLAASLKKMLDVIEGIFDRDPDQLLKEEMEEYIAAAVFCDKTIARKGHRVNEVAKILIDMGKRE